MKQHSQSFHLTQSCFWLYRYCSVSCRQVSLLFILIPTGIPLWILPEKIAIGSFFIFAAGLVDFLDGFIARLFKASSEMGKQLDSLADVVSFGVAPGLIFYQLLRISFARETDGLDISIAALLPAFLVPCCSSMAVG